ncbi:hypothetical protein D9M70_568400 [compost metagenome]
MIILHLLARALLHVGGGDDTEIDRRRHAVLRPRAFGALNHERGNIVAFALERIGDHDLRGPSVAIVRNQLANESIATLVAAHRLQRRTDILDDCRDAESLGDETAKAKAFRIGIVFRHE